MKNLSNEELLNINGGRELMDSIAYSIGYGAGRAFDFVHGVVDGIIGEKH